MLYTLFDIIIAGGLITHFLVSNGYGLEENPFLQAWIGKDIFLAMKVSGAFIATLILWIKYNSRPKLIYGITTVFLTLYTGIIFWNMFVFIAVWVRVFQLTISIIRIIPNGMTRGLGSLKLL